MARMQSCEVYAPRDLIDRVGEYQFQNDIDSMSQAWRELARRGLQAQEVDA